MSTRIVRDTLRWETEERLYRIYVYIICMCWKMSTGSSSEHRDSSLNLYAGAIVLKWIYLSSGCIGFAADNIPRDIVFLKFYYK